MVPAGVDTISGPALPLRKLSLRKLKRILGAGPSDPLIETSPLSSRAGVRRARICGPIDEIAAEALIGGDDVGDLAGQAGNVQGGGVDDLDPGDVGGADPPELGEDVGRFAREALAVDQHVAGRLAEAAPLGVAFDDREARHLVQHVQRVARREAGEIGGRVGARALRRGGFGRDRRRRVPPPARRPGRRPARPSRARRAAARGGRRRPRSTASSGVIPSLGRRPLRRLQSLRATFVARDLAKQHERQPNGAARSRARRNGFSTKRFFLSTKLNEEGRHGRHRHRRDDPRGRAARP